MADVSTLEKLGADFVPRVYDGYAVRAATPPDRIAKLRAAFKAAVDDPDLQAQMKRIDLIPQRIEPKGYEETLRRGCRRCGEARSTGRSSSRPPHGITYIGSTRPGGCLWVSRT